MASYRIHHLVGQVMHTADIKAIGNMLFLQACLAPLPSEQ
jgi:hypothetical protein